MKENIFDIYLEALKKRRSPKHYAIIVCDDDLSEALDRIAKFASIRETDEHYFEATFEAGMRQIVIKIFNSQFPEAGTGYLIDVDKARSYNQQEATE